MLLVRLNAGLKLVSRVVSWWSRLVKPLGSMSGMLLVGLIHLSLGIKLTAVRYADGPAVM